MIVIIKPWPSSPEQTFPWYFEPYQMFHKHSITAA